MSVNPTKLKTFMRQKLLALIFLLGFFNQVQAQKDTAGLSLDTTVNYDELFSELDNFLDSLLTPRSFTLVNVSAGSSVFNYTTSSADKLSESRQLMLLP